MAERLLRLPEDQWYDRKSARIQARELADALVGMANAEGGTIVIGLRDGIVEDVDQRPERPNDWRQAPLDFTVPTVTTEMSSVSVLDTEGRPAQLLLVEVPASQVVHANRRDEVFLRAGDETRRLSFRQRRELEFDKGQSNYEVTPTRILHRSDLDEGALARLADRLGSGGGDRLLRARGLGGASDRDRTTVGAALLFAAEPQAELPESFVRVLRYRGRERGTGRRQQILADRRIEGPLPEQLREVQAVMADLLPVRRALGRDGVFTDVGAVPTDAWLEGIVNAVTHRSYSLSGDHIRVEIFDDRLEIESPGRFPGIVDVGRADQISRFARNPRIARVLSDLDFGQELGEGIRRIYEEMRLSGLAEPHYHQTAGSVRLTLSAELVDRELEERLPPTARDLIRVIRELERASTGHLVRATGRSRPSVIKDLKALEHADILKWYGTSPKDPRAYWHLPNE